MCRQTGCSATAEQIAAADPANPQLPLIIWCSPGAAPAGTPRVSDKPCQGGGTTYSTTVKFPRGTRLAFRYFTVTPSNPNAGPEVFFKSYAGEFPSGPGDFEVLKGDVTNSAWYSFGASGQQTPSQMPATGAGGARSELALAAALVLALTLLVAGLGAVRRAARFR